MTTSPSHRAQEILLTFAAEGEPTPKRLEAFTKEYPDLRRELTDLAVELVLEPSRPVPRLTPRRRAPCRRHGLASRQASPAPGEVPGRRGGRAFAGRLRGLRRPVIPTARGPARSDTRLPDQGPGWPYRGRVLPKALARDIADEVGHGVDTVIALLERPASMPAGTMAKADGKPEVGVKQTFEEAVANSGLTADQRRRLLAMAEAERGSD